MCVCVCVYVIRHMTLSNRQNVSKSPLMLSLLIYLWVFPAQTQTIAVSIRTNIWVLNCISITKHKVFFIFWNIFFVRLCGLWNLCFIYIELWRSSLAHLFGYFFNNFIKCALSLSLCVKQKQNQQHLYGSCPLEIRYWIFSHPIFFVFPEKPHRASL